VTHRRLRASAICTWLIRTVHSSDLHLAHSHRSQQRFAPFVPRLWFCALPRCCFGRGDSPLWLDCLHANVEIGCRSRPFHRRRRRSANGTRLVTRRMRLVLQIGMPARACFHACTVACAKKHVVPPNGQCVKETCCALVERACCAYLWVEKRVVLWWRGRAVLTCGETCCASSCARFHFAPKSALCRCRIRHATPRVQPTYVLFEPSSTS
jgi:hypothetical protein